MLSLTVILRSPNIAILGQRSTLTVVVEKEVAMKSYGGLLAALFGALVVSGVFAKPPDDAPRLDDEKQEVTRTLKTGKVEKSTVELKYYLQVKGAFDDDGFTLETVEPGGPATTLIGDNGMV